MKNTIQINIKKIENAKLSTKIVTIVFLLISAFVGGTSLNLFGDTSSQVVAHTVDLWCGFSVEERKSFMEEVNAKTKFGNIKIICNSDQDNT